MLILNEMYQLAYSAGSAGRCDLLIACGNEILIAFMMSSIHFRATRAMACWSFSSRLPRSRLAWESEVSKAESPWVGLPTIDHSYGEHWSI